MLNPTLTAEVINNDQWKKRFSDDWPTRWEQSKAEYVPLKVGDLIVIPKMSAQSAVLRLRVVVELKEDGRVMVQGEHTKKSRLMCPERCLVIGRVND